MSEAPDNHALDRRLAVLEERMNTMQANLAETLERFEANSARRETRLILAVAGILGLGLAIHGYITGQTPAPSAQQPVIVIPSAPVPAPAAETPAP